MIYKANFSTKHKVTHRYYLRYPSIYTIAKDNIYKVSMSSKLRSYAVKKKVT
jgi:hypothetical protein